MKPRKSPNKSPSKTQKTPTLNQLLRSFFHRAGVNEKHIDIFVTSETLKNFQLCFIHKSIDKDNNYEYYEFFGDVIVNRFVVLYLEEILPNVKSVKWLSKIKSAVQADKFLSKIAIREGIDKLAIYDEEMKNLKENPHLDSRNLYNHMLGDIMEAICGFMNIIVRSKGFSDGVATQIAVNLLKTFYRPSDIPTKYEDVFDPVSRLKELYEKRGGPLPWGGLEQLHQIFHTKKIEGEVPKFKCTIYGWLDQGKPAVPTKFNKKELAMAEGVDESQCKQKAAKLALDYLKKNFGITDIPALKK
jgi:dsRNA-specific ribonuclease